MLSTFNPVGDARLDAFVQVGKDAAPNHVAGLIEADLSDRSGYRYDRIVNSLLGLR
jgi:hypothetical protein